jgi:hypothetical protein
MIQLAMIFIAPLWLGLMAWVLFGGAILLYASCMDLWDRTTNRNVISS